MKKKKKSMFPNGSIRLPSTKSQRIILSSYIDRIANGEAVQNIVRDMTLSGNGGSSRPLDFERQLLSLYQQIRSVAMKKQAKISTDQQPYSSLHRLDPSYFADETVRNKAGRSTGFQTWTKTLLDAKKAQKKAIRQNNEVAEKVQRSIIDETTRALYERITNLSRAIREDDNIEERIRRYREPESDFDYDSDAEQPTGLTEADFQNMLDEFSRRQLTGEATRRHADENGNIISAAIDYNQLSPIYDGVPKEFWADLRTIPSDQMLTMRYVHETTGEDYIDLMDMSMTELEELLNSEEEENDEE